MENKIEKINILGTDFYLTKNESGTMMVLSKTKEEIENNLFKIKNHLNHDEYEPVGLYGNTTIKNQLENRNVKFTDYFNSSDYMRFVSVPDKNYFVLSRPLKCIYSDTNFDEMYIRPVFYKTNDHECKMCGVIFFKTDDLADENSMIDVKYILNNKYLCNIIKTYIDIDYKHWIIDMHHIFDYEDEVVFRLDQRYYLKTGLLKDYIIKEYNIITTVVL